ncbi:VF530 family protein [Chromobacterium haemolyticum]|uniref:VF530 family protein n=1 Tax=Chromobacterium haemolyticum TaxID=394935 RepID=UPI00307F4D89
MSAPQPKNPTHGVTLEQMLNQLVGHYGWPELGRRIQIRCFNHDPSVKSSLAFLRRTPWARQQVEDLFVALKTRPQTPAGSGTDSRPRLFAKKSS